MPLLECWQISMQNVRVSTFSDLVVIDAYARFWKILLYSVTGVTIVLSLPYLKAERIHLGEYYGFLLLALSGFHYSAPEATIAFAPRVSAEDFRCFFSTGSAWGLYSQTRAGEEQRHRIEVR